MAAIPPKYVTTSQDGIGGDREFVVACKGRPFTILTPSHLPTPAVSFVDHKLVAELKLRMSDLQCSRLNYGSKKLRILGKISTSVQCIFDGQVSGNLHMKALVVENLCEHFEVHSIAGIKINQLLTFHPSLVQDTSSENDEPTTPPRKKKKKKTIPPESYNLEKTPHSTPSSSPAQVITLPYSAAATARIHAVNAAVTAQAKLSPDLSVFQRAGYPPSYNTPQASPTSAAFTARVNAIQAQAKLSPDLSVFQRAGYPPSYNTTQASPTSAAFTARVNAIQAQAKLSPDLSVFQKAGYPPSSPRLPVFATEESPSSQLPRRSPPGFPTTKYSPSANISRLCSMGGVMIGQLGSGQDHPVFYPDHGPRRCLPSCRVRDPPLNCGYNEDWYLPSGFQMCGPACRGAFCDCLRDYSDYGYYG
jgi:hypothetical protein